MRFCLEKDLGRLVDEGERAGERYFEAGPAVAVVMPPKVHRSSKRRSEGVRGEEGAELDGRRGRGGVAGKVSGREGVLVVARKSEADCRE